MGLVQEVLLNLLYMVGFTGTKSLERLGIKLFWHHALLITLIQSQSKPRFDPSIRRDWSGAHRLLYAIWPKSSVVKGIWAGNKSRAKPQLKGRSGLLLMVLASETSVIQWSTTPPLCLARGPAYKNVPAYPPQPASRPRRGSTPSSLCHSPSFAGRLCIRPRHFTSWGGKAAEMCTTHGRNYIL